MKIVETNEMAALRTAYQKPIWKLLGKKHKYEPISECEHQRAVELQTICRKKYQELLILYFGKYSRSHRPIT